MINEIQVKRPLINRARMAINRLEINYFSSPIRVVNNVHTVQFDYNARPTQDWNAGTRHACDWIGFSDINKRSEIR